MQPMSVWTYPKLVHHRKWRIGEYLVTYILFVTLLVEFLVELRQDLAFYNVIVVVQKMTSRSVS